MVFTNARLRSTLNCNVCLPPITRIVSCNLGAYPIRATLPAPVVQNPPATAGYMYTVKESDSLWRIAREQLGDAGAVASIKELNKEVLAGGDQVRPNMKLRLPAKPVN